MEESGNDLAIGHLGAVFILNDESGGPWSKLSIGFNYNKTVNYDNNYSAEGINPNRGLDDYFLFFAQGKRLDEISQFFDENFNQAYTNIGETDNLGYAAQQALFGYEGYDQSSQSAIQMMLQILVFELIKAILNQTRNIHINITDLPKGNQNGIPWT